MSIVEPTTMPETTRRTAIDTSSSISVNPPSLLGVGGAHLALAATVCRQVFVRTLVITGSSERKRLERADRGARSERPCALRRSHDRRHGNLFQVRSRACHLPDALVVPIVCSIPVITVWRRSTVRRGNEGSLHI